MSAVAGRSFGIIGSVVGLLGLIAAVLPLWLLPAIYPPRPADQVIVDTAQRVRDRIAARVRGVEYEARQETNPREFWYRAFSVAAVSLGLIAIALAVVSVLRREEWRYAGTAAAVGVGAIAFQAVMAALGALIAIVIIALIIQHFGLGL
jgi:hypothetical protein